MLTVITKQLIECGKWGCSCTYQCYDHYEAGNTIEEAQQAMKEKLTQRGYEGELHFEEPKPYVKSAPITGQRVEPIGYAPYRIDKGMV